MEAIPDTSSKTIHESDDVKFLSCPLVTDPSVIQSFVSLYTFFRYFSLSKTSPSSISRTSSAISATKFRSIQRCFDCSVGCLTCPRSTSHPMRFRDDVKDACVAVASPASHRTLPLPSFQISPNMVLHTKSPLHSIESQIKMLRFLAHEKGRTCCSGTVLLL